MSTAPDATRFAPSERAAPEVINRQSDLLQSFRQPPGIPDAAFGALLVLNRQRQIVYCNPAFSELLGGIEPRSLYGLRPGEALQCPYSAAAGGCGAGEHCSTCGAVLAILGSQLGREEVRECRLNCGPRGDALELIVRAAPLEIAGEAFSVLAVADISHEKRRRALERTFFHDLMNTAAGLRFQAECLARHPDQKTAHAASNIHDGLKRLIDEIDLHRKLMAAEKQDLPVRPMDVQSRELLEEVLQSYQPVAQSQGCLLRLDERAEDVRVHTDIAIMSRVLGNMVKNAVEASSAGQVVTVGCRQEQTNATFWVHNSAHMPRDVQLQVFQRSFSTKGEGRGLGTYGMKLLCERYLGGQVAFTSNAEAGTTFTAALPFKT